MNITFTRQEVESDPPPGQDALNVSVEFAGNIRTIPLPVSIDQPPQFRLCQGGPFASLEAVHLTEEQLCELGMYVISCVRHLHNIGSKSNAKVLRIDQPGRKPRWAVYFEQIEGIEGSE